MLTQGFFMCVHGSKSNTKKPLRYEEAFIIDYKFGHLFYQYQFLGNHFVVNINLYNINTIAVFIKTG